MEENQYADNPSENQAENQRLGRGENPARDTSDRKVAGRDGEPASIPWANEEVPLVDLPRVEAVDFQKHPVRFMTYRYAVNALWWSLPVIGAVLTFLFSRENWTLGSGAALVILMVLSYVAVPISYHRRAYALRTRDIIYKKGWLFKSITTVPFNRIQHTEVSQGPIERRYALATLRIYTAGGSSSDLAIPGLDRDTAGELREFIARKAAIDE